MTKQDLNGSQVGAGFEQVSGEAVAQSVNGDVFAQTCSLAGAVAGSLDASRGNGAVRSGAGEEEIARPSSLPVGAENAQQPRGKHDIAILLPSPVHVDDHTLAVDVGNAQAGDLGDAQARGVGGHDDGPVLEVGDGGEEPRRPLQD